MNMWNRPEFGTKEEVEEFLKEATLPALDLHCPIMNDTCNVRCPAFYPAYAYKLSGINYPEVWTYAGHCCDSPMLVRGY